MKLFPATLFGRLLLLTLMVVIAAQAAMWWAFRQDRESAIVRELSQSKIAQIKALESTIASMPPQTPRATFDALARSSGAYIVSTEERPVVGMQPRGPRFRLIVEQLTNAFGGDKAVRLGQRRGEPVIWLRMENTKEQFWVGFPITPGTERVPVRLVSMLSALLLLSIAAAYWFARRATRPLNALANAADALGRGNDAPSVPETGPAEIASVAKRFNAMRDNLARTESERAVMLAGVSHDIRTPLTRLKLELELANVDQDSKRAMTGDIEEIERTVGQFLDFAKISTALARAPTDIETLMQQRYARERVHRGDAITLHLDTQLPLIDANAPSLDRALANLIDNAFRYGGERVEMRASHANHQLRIEIADHGPGIPAEDVERLLQPFTRGEQARSNASGAGLGLAIVDRIAKLHGGTLSIHTREGGGTRACIDIPIAVNT